MDEPESYTPTDIARRVAAMGVLVNPAVVWAYLRTRFADRYPDRAPSLDPTRLSVAPSELDEWLDDFLDGVEAERTRLSRALHDRAQRDEG